MKQPEIKKKKVSIPQDEVKTGSEDNQLMRSDIQCPKCGERLLEIWSSSEKKGPPALIECTKCDYKNTWYGHLGEMLYMVDDLPQSVYSTFTLAMLKKQYKKEKSPKSKRKT